MWKSLNADILRKRFLLLLFLSVTTFCFSQDYDYKTVIKTLTDSSFHGRGYVNNGDQKAADYLAEIYKHYELKSFEDNYFQSFELDVNTFPKKVDLRFKGETLVLGDDYLVHPISGSGEGTYRIRNISYQNVDSKEKLLSLKENHQTGIIYTLQPDEYEGDELQLMRSLPFYIAQFAPVIIQQENKLMWSVGREAMPFPIIQIGPNFTKKLNGKIQIDIQNKLVKKYKSQNVIGYVEGTKYKDKYIIICGHYDHLGSLGQVFFPGGNDNASGTAGMLEMMKHFSKNPHEYSIIFIAFGGEEAGLVGSSFYVEHPLVPLEKTKFVLDLDIMGSADDGITVVNRKKHTERFEKLKAINDEKNYIPSVKPRAPTQNSDHAPFDQKGIEAFFIYTRGSAEKYHEVSDTYENLPLVNFEELVNLLIDFTNTIE